MTANKVPGYHSATEYKFCKKQADAICQTAAYHRRDYDLAVVWFVAREHADIRASIATPFPKSSDKGLGSLEKLPLELLYDVLVCLDMHSLFKFRQICLRSRELVDSLHRYQMVASHGLNAFCALLRTHLADVSLIDFYDTLCIKFCTLCGEFGGFVSLLTWKRCCFWCLQTAPELQVQTVAAARKQFRLTKAEINELKTFKTIPGIYSMDETTQKSRITVVSVDQITSLVKRNHPTLSQLERSSRREKLNFMGAVALPYYDNATGKVDGGLSCAGCQLALEKDIIGARGEDWAFRVRDKIHSRDGFLDHFRWCLQAQNLWESSAQGAHEPSELPVGARRGGYFSVRE